MKGHVERAWSWATTTVTWVVVVVTTRDERELVSASYRAK